MASDLSARMNIDIFSGEPMRFLHSSDWHLGKTLCNANLIEDQSHALDEIVSMIRETKAEALVVSGDIFDRATPSPQSLNLLDDFLKRVIPHLQCSVMFITGNHDRLERLALSTDLSRQQGLHVASRIDEPARFVPIGDCAFHLLPYADPQSYKAFFPNQTFPNHQAVLQHQLAASRAIHPEGFKCLAVAHASVAGSIPAESELDLGEAVDPNIFEGLDYAALGHFHCAQDGPIHHYPGSLLKYAASESQHRKGLNLVTWDVSGNVQTEQLPFSPKRDLRRISGHLLELLETPQGNTEDYIFAQLSDSKPVPDAMNRLRSVYPNILGLENGIEVQETDRTSGRKPRSPEDLKSLEAEHLFSSFLAQSTGDGLSETERAIFREITAQHSPLKGMQP